MIVVGVLCEIGATMLGTVGKQLVSFSGRVESKEQAKMYKVAGLLITTLIGPILDMAAYAFAPQAIIAPLNGLDIVWNTMSAPYTLGERLTRRHVIGSGLVFVGAAFTSLMGPHHEQQESLEWLEDKFLGMRFAMYVATFGGLLLLSLTILKSRPKGTGDKMRGIALGCTAGGIAGNMFFISAGLGLIRSSAATDDWSAWSHVLPYPVLLCGVLVAVANIPFMTKGLQEFEALFMVTLFEGCHITVACVSGVWVLGEMDGQEPAQIVLYWCSILVIGAGLLVIQSAAAGGTARHARSDGRPLNTWEEAAAEPNRAVSAKSVETAAAEDPAALEAGSGSEAEPQPSVMGRRESGMVVWASITSGLGVQMMEAGLGDSEEDAGTSSESTGEESSVPAGLNTAGAEDLKIASQA